MTKKPDRKHEPEDCPTDVKNREEGYRPAFRVSIWRKEGTPEIYIHSCGEATAQELAKVVNFLSYSLAKALGQRGKR